MKKMPEQRPIAGENKEPAAMPDEAQPTGAQPAGAQPAEDMGGNKSEYKEYSDAVKMLIYSDAKAFGSMVKMLQAGENRLSETVSDIALTLIGKMEKDMGEISIDSLQAAGITAIVHVFDVADKIGLANDITKEMVLESVSLAFSKWIQKNPDRIDKNDLQSAMQSPETKDAIQQLQGGTQAPDQMASGMVKEDM